MVDANDDAFNAMGGYNQGDLPGSNPSTWGPQDRDPQEWNKNSRFDALQIRWLAANMEIDELMKLGKLDDDTVQSIKAMIKTIAQRPGSRGESLAPPSENRSAEYVVALAKELNAEGVGVPFDSKKWLAELDKEDKFFFPDGSPTKDDWMDEEDPTGEIRRRKNEKFNRPIPDYLQGVYAFPDELSGGISKEPIPVPPEFITEFYFKVGPKTVQSKTLTEDYVRTLNVKSVEEDPFVEGMWNIEVTDNDGGSVPKVTINENTDPHLFDMDSLYKLMVQELTAKKAPDWLIRRAEELPMVQKTRLTEDGNTELMVGVGASALLLLLLFI